MKPESAYEYELGLIQEWKPLTYRTAVFHYDIENFINDNGITAPGTGLGSDAVYNIPHVKLYGVEFEATYRPTKRLQATASYVFQQVAADETQYDASYTYYLPELLPKHKVRLMGRYEAWKDGFIQLSGRFVGERQAQKGATLDAYFTLDASVEQVLKIMGQEYTLGAYVSNLTGEEYQEQSGYDMPRQVYGLRLTAKF